MKSFLLVAILAISCALAKDVTSVEVRPMTCYQSCTGFADYLKAKKVDNPVEEAKKFCADAKIQVCYHVRSHSIWMTLNDKVVEVMHFHPNNPGKYGLQLLHLRLSVHFAFPSEVFLT